MSTPYIDLTEWDYVAVRELAKQVYADELFGVPYGLHLGDPSSTKRYILELNIYSFRQKHPRKWAALMARRALGV